MALPHLIRSQVHECTHLSELPPTLHSAIPHASSGTMASHTSDAVEEVQYRPKDAIGETIKATMITTGAGAFISTVQNTLVKQNIGAMGMFTRTGGTIAVFGMALEEAVREGKARTNRMQVLWEEHTSSRDAHPPTLGRRTMLGTTQWEVSLAVACSD